MKTALTIVSLCSTLALAGCTSLKYEDPAKVETVTIDFGSTDLQMLPATWSSP